AQLPGLHVLIAAAGPPPGDLTVAAISADAPDHSPRIRQHATAPPLLAAPSPPAGPPALAGRQLRIVPEPDPARPAGAVVPDRAGRPRRPTLGRRAGHRHEPRRARPGHPPRDAARRGASAVAGGVVPRP